MQPDNRGTDANDPNFGLWQTNSGVGPSHCPLEHREGATECAKSIIDHHDGVAPLAIKGAAEC